MKLNENLVPDSDLMESMRAIGYSLETAVADLCDNSVSAGATKIDVAWGLGSAPHVMILDDGSGMTKDELRLAMKLAGKPPSQARGKQDLGRFGLGLKTASLSQARCLTVITKKNGEILGAQWDLDYLQETNSWSLRWLENEAMLGLPGYSLLSSRTSGTLVLWEKLDQIANSEELLEAAIAEKFESVANHLGLVFHRFIGSKSRPLKIRINSRHVPVFDPFLEGEPGVIDRGVTYVDVHGETVSVQPFILPSLTRMTASQKEKALFDLQKMSSAQGFYVYRSYRLISWGTWFRMAPKDVSGKLARVRVDIGNSLDSHWKLGVMKSSVEPPTALKEALRRLVPEIIENSIRAVRGKNNPISAGKDGVWQVEELGSKAFALKVNRSHPLLVRLSESLDQDSQRSLESVVKLIEASIPASYLHQRLSQDNALKEGLDDDEDIWSVASELFNRLKAVSQADVETVWAMVEATEPFRSDVQAKSKLRTLIKRRDNAQ